MKQNEEFINVILFTFLSGFVKLKQISNKLLFVKTRKIIMRIKVLIFYGFYDGSEESHFPLILFYFFFTSNLFFLPKTFSTFNFFFTSNFLFGSNCYFYFQLFILLLTFFYFLHFFLLPTVFSLPTFVFTSNIFLLPTYFKILLYF